MQAQVYQAEEMTANDKVITSLYCWTCNTKRSNVSNNNITKERKGIKVYRSNISTYHCN